MKYSVDENMLLDMLSESNEDVRDALYEKYAPMILFLVKKYLKKALKLGLESKDLIQEANLAFADAINSYNPEKDASLKTFITICIERRLIKIIEKNETKKSQMEKDTLSLEFEYDEDGSKLNDFIADPSLDPSLSYFEQEELKNLQIKIEEVLSDSELVVYKHMLEGLSYQKIAILLDKSPKQIDNTIQRIRFKLRRVLEGERNV